MASNAPRSSLREVGCEFERSSVRYVWRQDPADVTGIAATATRDDIPRMTCTLLAERCTLVVHREQGEMPVYSLCRRYIKRRPQGPERIGRAAADLETASRRGADPIAAVPSVRGSIRHAL